MLRASTAPPHIQPAAAHAPNANGETNTSDDPSRRGWFKLTVASRPGSSRSPGGPERPRSAGDVGHSNHNLTPGIKKVTVPDGQDLGSLLCRTHVPKAV